MKEREGLLVQGPRGRIFTGRLALDSVYFYFEGHVDLAMFEPTMGFANEVAGTGKGRLYGDGASWKTYEAGYRNAWTTWFLANRTRVAHTRLVVTSPILRMGVTVVNLFASNPIESLATSTELNRLIVKDHPRLHEIAAAWPDDISEHLRRR